MTDYEKEIADRKTYEAERKLWERRLAGEVAAALGNDWEVEHRTNGDGDHYRSILKGPNGAEIWFHVGGKESYSFRNRIHLSPDFPRDKSNSRYGPKYNESFDITVADTKPAPVIAKDITRRLLPKYLPALIKGWEQFNERASQDSKRDYFFAQFMKALGEGASVVDTHGSRQPELRYYRHKGAPVDFLEAQTYSSHDSDVTIKLSASRDTALALAKMIGKLNRTPKESNDVESQQLYFDDPGRGLSEVPALR